MSQNDDVHKRAHNPDRVLEAPPASSEENSSGEKMCDTEPPSRFMATSKDKAVRMDFT